MKLPLTFEPGGLNNRLGVLGGLNMSEDNPKPISYSLETVLSAAFSSSVTSRVSSLKEYSNYMQYKLSYLLKAISRID